MKDGLDCMDGSEEIGNRDEMDERNEGEDGMEEARKQGMHILFI